MLHSNYILNLEVGVTSGLSNIKPVDFNQVVVVHTSISALGEAEAGRSL